MASVRLPERAEAFKEDGNVHFKAGEFSKAFISYTAAISEAPTSAVLYSNRSATAAKMGKYSQAVSDAKKSVELDPKWHKAHGRLATAHELNNEGSYATISYMKAATLTTDNKLKAEYEASADRLSKRLQNNALAAAQVYSTGGSSSGMSAHNPLERWKTMTAQGYPFRPNSAAVRFGTAATAVQEAWKGIHELKSLKTMPDGRPLPPGATGLMLGKFGQISELVAGILVDPENAFVFVPSEEHRDPVALLNAQISFEVQKVNAAPRKATVAQIIQHNKELLKKANWGDGTTPGARDSLALTIRSDIMNGLLLELMILDYGTALDCYERASSTIEFARATWPGEDKGDAAGTSLQHTFLRGVKARVLHCKIALVLKAQEPPPDSDYAQIERLANEIVQSCDEFPSVLTPFDTPENVVHWVAFYSTIRADAHLALGLLYRARGERNTRMVDGLEYPSPVLLRKCMEHYAKAAAWFPVDDYHCGESIWYALDAGMRLGGMDLKGVDEMINRARHAEKQHSFFFGDRKITTPNNSRDSVLGMREKLFTFGKETAKTSPEKVVLKPLPLAIHMKHNPDTVNFMMRMDEEYAQAPIDPATVGPDGTVAVNLVLYVGLEDEVVKKEVKKGPSILID